MGLSITNTLTIREVISAQQDSVCFAARRVVVKVLQKKICLLWNNVLFIVKKKFCLLWKKIVYCRKNFLFIFAPSRIFAFRIIFRILSRQFIKILNLPNLEFSCWYSQNVSELSRITYIHLGMPIFAEFRLWQETYPWKSVWISLNFIHLCIPVIINWTLCLKYQKPVCINLNFTQLYLKSTWILCLMYPKSACSQNRCFWSCRVCICGLPDRWSHSMVEYPYEAS